MRGETVLYFGGHYEEDQTHNIVSLQADWSARPLGETFTWGIGTGNAYSATVCDGGSSRNIKEFGLRVDVRNAQDRPLVVEIFERFSDTDEPSEISGAFVPSNGSGTVYELVVAEPWLRAYDQTGSLVYTTRLELKETQTVTIPAGPVTIDEIPRQGVARSLRSGCLGLSSIVLEIAIFAAPIMVFVGGGIVVVWMIATRRRRRGRHY